MSQVQILSSRPLILLEIFRSFPLKFVDLVTFTGSLAWISQVEVQTARTMNSKGDVWVADDN